MSLQRSQPGKGQARRVAFDLLVHPEAFRVDFVDVYGKDEKDDLTPQEKKLLAGLAARMRQEAIDAFTHRRR